MRKGGRARVQRVQRIQSEGKKKQAKSSADIPSPQRDAVIGQKNKRGNRISPFYLFLFSWLAGVLLSCGQWGEVELF